MYCSVIFWCLLTLWCCGDSFQEKLNGQGAVISYSSMPELFALDHYERCSSSPGWAYCVLDVHLARVPGHPYDDIMAYSSRASKHYNYSRLHRGVCISERCGLHREAAASGDQLLACINRTLLQQAGVQVGQVKVHYCNSAEQEVTPLDTLDYIVAAIAAAVVVLAISGTVHHARLRAGAVKENRYAMAFSVMRNWDDLMTGRKTDTFQCFQGMRFLTMILIIGIHAVMAVAFGYTSNPEFIEQSYDHPLKQLMLNVRVTVQTYFVMSGFLLAHNTIGDMDTKPLSLRDLPTSIFKRYIRLLPTALLAMGAMATWVPRLGSGPLWDLIVRREQQTCRANWWRQLFFIQNYSPLDQVCLLQTWYLAADLQLHVLGLLVLVMLSRWRRRGWLLLSAVLALSLSLPALQTYIFNMMPFRASLYPETFINLFDGNSSFLMSYTTIQANWTGYTLGVLTAYIHHNAKKNGLDLHNSLILKRLYYMSLPVALCAMWAGAEFHTRTATRLEAVLFNALDHNVFGAAMCVFILGCIYKCDSVLRGCVEWAPLQPLGKLSFCALLTHMAVLWTYTGHLASMQHASVYSIVFMVLATTAVTYIASVPLFLLVEQPSYHLQRILFSSSKSSVCAQSPQLNGHAQHNKSQ